jgi:hypothetical protein
VSNGYRQTDRQTDTDTWPKARVTPCGSRRLHLTKKTLRVQILKSNALRHTENAVLLGCDSLAGCLPKFRRNVLPSCTPKPSTKLLSKPQISQTKRLACKTKLTKHSSCSMSIIVQQDATMYSLLYFCKLLYMFRVVTPPIIRNTYNCNYSIILGMKLYTFPTVPLSIIRSSSLYTQQWYMSYTFADIYHCCVYSEKLLMINRGTVQNMKNFISRIYLRKWCI